MKKEIVIDGEPGTLTVHPDKVEIRIMSNDCSMRTIEFTPQALNDLLKELIPVDNFFQKVKQNMENIFKRCD